MNHDSLGQNSENQSRKWPRGLRWVVASMVLVFSVLISHVWSQNRWIEVGDRLAQVGRTPTAQDTANTQRNNAPSVVAQTYSPAVAVPISNGWLQPRQAPIGVPVAPATTSPEENSISGELNELIDQYRRANSEQREKLKVRVVDIVEKLFAMRHKHHADRLEALSKELESARAMLKDREQHKSEIITRRVNGLLEQPDPLDWDTTPLTAQPMGQQNSYVRQPYPQQTWPVPVLPPAYSLPGQQSPAYYPPGKQLVGAAELSPYEPQPASNPASNRSLKGLSRSAGSDTMISSINNDFSHEALVTAGYEYLAAQTESNDIEQLYQKKQAIAFHDVSKSRLRVRQAKEIWEHRRETAANVSKLVRNRLSFTQSQQGFTEDSQKRQAMVFEQRQLEFQLESINKSIEWAEKFQRESIAPMLKNTETEKKSPDAKLDETSTTNAPATSDNKLPADTVR